MQLVEPAVLWCLAPALLLVVLFELRLDGSWSRRAMRFVVRGALLSALILALGGAFVSRHHPVAPRLVVAVEHTVAPDAFGDAAWALVDRAARTAQREGFQVTVIPYGHRAHAPAPYAADLRAQLPSAESGTPQPARALRAAADVYAPEESGGVLLIASGHGAHADLREAAAALRSRGLRVAAWATPNEGITTPARPEVVALDAPEETADPFTVHAAARTQSPSDVVLWVDGARRDVQAIGANPDRPVDVSFPTTTLTPGLHHLAVTIEPKDGTPASPEVERDVEVTAPPRYVGCVDAGSIVRRALEVQGIKVQWYETATDLALRLPDPSKATSTQPIDVLIADADLLVKLPATAQDKVVGWVRAGMGLVVTVGKTKNAWRDLGKTRIAPLLPLTPQAEPEPEPQADPPPAPLPPKPDVDPPKKDEGPGLKTQVQPDEAHPITLLLLIDKSMSMSTNGKFEMAIRAASLAAEKLGSSDRLGIMTFGEKTQVVVKPRANQSPKLIALALGGLQPDGRATNIYLALKDALDVMRVQETSIKHVMLITDGEQYPEGPIFGPVVSRMRLERISLTAVGIGRGAKMGQLRHMTRFAYGGLALYAPTPRDVPTLIVKDTDKVVRARNMQAEAEGLLHNENDTREPKEDNEEEGLALPELKDPAQDLPEPKERKATTLAPLRKVRRHEAVASFPTATGPGVLSPRKSTPRPHGYVLLVREADAPVLAAARAGLGRVFTWTLQDDDEGFRGWEPAAALIAQIVRAARTPQQRFTHRPRVQVVQRPDGGVLQVTWPEGAARGGFEVTWVGPTQTKSLGRMAAGTTRERIALPTAPPGSSVTLQFTDKGKASLPPRTYRVAEAQRKPVPAGDQAALDAHIGARPPDLSRLVSTLPFGQREERRPIWAWLLWGALALLPLDVFLHRRTR